MYPVAPHRSRRIATLPNALSVIALLLGLAGLWRGWFADDMYAAVLCGLIGGALCVLDGMVANWTSQHTELGDKQLQPLAGLTLSVSVVGTLVLQGYWPLWVAIVLAGIAVFLQIISVFADRMPRLKRHQFWLHPMYANIVLYVALTALLQAYADPHYRTPVYIGAVTLAVVLVAVRWPRYKEWFAGPAGQW